MTVSVASSRGLVSRDMFLLLSHWSSSSYSSVREGRLECGLLYYLTEARGGQYPLGRGILLLAFVSLSRELVRLRQALEWHQ